MLEEPGAVVDSVGKAKGGVRPGEKQRTFHGLLAPMLSRSNS